MDDQFGQLEEASEGSPDLMWEPQSLEKAWSS